MFLVVWKSYLIGWLWCSFCISWFCDILFWSGICVFLVFWCWYCNRFVVLFWCGCCCCVWRNRYGWFCVVFLVWYFRFILFYVWWRWCRMGLGCWGDYKVVELWVCCCRIGCCDMIYMECLVFCWLVWCGSLCNWCIDL